VPPHPITPTIPTPSVRASSTAPASATRTGTFRLDTRWAGRSPAASADAVWVPAVSATLVLVVGVISLATGQPWLTVGLGPTALLIASHPGSSMTRFHNIVGGHLVAFVCAWFALLLLGVNASPKLLSGQSIPVVRVWASAIAIAITALVQPSLRAYHPPAAATALLVTLGMFKLTWKSSFSMLAGVLVVALLGEWFQRIRLRERQAHSTKA
jgi:CBS-domain-containing membrane protein